MVSRPCLLWVQSRRLAQGGASGTGECIPDCQRAGIFSGGPTLAATSSRTCRLLLFPADRELIGGEAFGFTGLPTGVRAGGIIELDAVQRSALDRKLGIDISRVDQMAIREQLLVRQSLVNGRKKVVIGGGGSGGLHVGDDVQEVLVAALRQMYSIADPGRRTLLRVMRFRIVRRVDHRGDRTNAFRLVPP